MSQRVVTSFINTNIPGAYPNVTVKSQPVGLGASGILVIIGEADGGPSYQSVVLANNRFSPDQLDKVTQTYISGQIVDAFRALSAPSNDTDISGTASVVHIIKTNQSAKASSLVDTSYGIFQDKNFGVPGNSNKFSITSIQTEMAPNLQGITIPAFGAALNAMTFAVRLEGSAATTITLSSTAANHADVPTLIVELNAQLPVGLVASAGTAPNSIQLTVTADAQAYHKGWSKSFELIDTVAGDLAAIGLVSGLVVSSAEPEVEVFFSNSNTGLNENFNVIPDIALNVGYAGTSATLTINAARTILTTTVTGGSGANLSVNMSQYKTIADLATYIAAQTGYSASAAAAAQQSPPLDLDAVSAIGIAATSASAQPGRIKDSASSFNAIVNRSKAIQFVSTSTAGLPNPTTSTTFLTGGTRGGTLAADVVNAVQQMAGIQCNIIIPLFSQDATADIAAGVTASSSTYTISAVNVLVKNHCIQYSTAELKRNRIAILSFNGTYLAAKQQAQGLANYRCSLTIQSCTQENSVGNIVQYQPWYGACVAAGMQAGGFYKSITNKLANVIAFSDPSGFDSGSPGDVSDALDAGLLIMNKNTSGNLWVSDQTTYGFDTNFVYNSLQAVYCSDILALDLAQSYQTAFVGKSLADVDAATALSFLAQKMDGYKKLKLIAASDDAPLGYKNPKVNILAPEMSISVEIKLATAIYFIPISISISQVQQSA